MKKSITFKLLLLLLLTCCITVFSACGSDGTDLEDFKPENGEAVDTEAEINKGENVEFTTVNSNAKIIRNVKINGETKNFTNATQTIKSKLYEAGGYIESSEISGGESLYGGRKTAKNAEYVLRIPGEGIDSFVESLETLLNVTSYSENTKDVTLDYYDIQSRIQTLETKRSALEALLSSSKNVDEIIAYQDELFEVITEIESLKSKLSVYDNKVNFSTVKLTVVEVVEYTETDTADKTFGDRLSDTFSSSWSGMGTFFEHLAIFLVAALPVLLFLGVIAAIVLTIIWLVRRNRKKKNKLQ